MRALVKPLLAADRRDHWSTESAYHWTVGAVQVDSSEGRIRTRLRELLWASLQRDDTAVDARELWWELLVESNHSAAASNALPGGGVWKFESQDDLRRVWEIRQRRQLAPAEYRHARGLWSRELRYPSSPGTKSLALQLETRFATENELGWLLEGEDAWFPESYDRLRARALTWLDSARTGDVETLLQRAEALGDSDREPRLRAVADAVGERALVSDGVRQTICVLLGDAREDRARFATFAVLRLVADTRKATPEVLSTLLPQVMEASGERRGTVLWNLYTNLLFSLTDEDIAFIETATRDASANPAVAFQLAGRVYVARSDLGQRLVARFVPLTQREQTANCFNALVEGAWLESHSRKETLPDDRWLWLVGLLEWVGDWDGASHMTIHQLTELHGKADNKIPLRWFAELLSRRDFAVGCFC